MNSKMSPLTLDNDRDQVAEAIRFAATELGTGGAATPMGALEMVAMELRDGSALIAGALSEVAAALQEIAAAIQESSDDA